MKNVLFKLMVVIFMICSAYGCRHRKNLSYDHIPAQREGNQGNYEYEQHAKTENLAELCPEDWYFQRESENVVLIKDTDLEVILSTGFVPDDYFMPNGYVNDEKYAESYVLIRLEEYEHEVNDIFDWHLFLKEYHPEVSDFRMLDRDEGQYGIMPIAFDGVMLGEKIVMISLSGKVMVVTLHFQGNTRDNAQRVFDQIVRSLR